MDPAPKSQPGRSLAPLVAWAAVTLVSVLVSSTSAAPNVLFIVSEDNGPELGCCGDPYARTPNLVRSLKAAGYRTGIVGKLHINPESAFPVDFRAIPLGNSARRGLGEYVKQVERFMRDGDGPFFLSVNYPEAHRPWLRQVDGLPAKPLGAGEVKPMAYLGVDEPQLRQHVADYYNCINRLDALVGNLLAALQRAGRAENTLVVYLGDHGADDPSKNPVSCQ